MEVVGRSVSADTQGLVVYARGIRAGLQKLRNEATVLFFFGGNKKNNELTHWTCCCKQNKSLVAHIEATLYDAT